MDRIDKFLGDLEKTFAYIREREGGDSVCGLCEYDGAYIGESGDWCNECPGFNRDDCFKLSDKIRKKWTDEIIKALPTIQPGKAQLSQEGTTFDLISKTETVEHLCRVLGATVPISDYDEGFVDGVEFGVSTVSTMPPAQPERPKGEWIDYTEDGYVECPFCHSATNCDGNKDELHFCFSCGADMRGEQHETD